MMNVVSFFIWLATASTPAATDTQSIISVLVTSSVIAAVGSATVTGIVQYRINKNNARITERKNDVDADSGLIDRYKEAAAEERSQKESAVKTVQDLLDIAEQQVTSLKSTIQTLNETITNLNTMANTQKSIIDQLTAERDRSVTALQTAMTQIDEQREKLVHHQQEILELTYPRSKVDELRGKMDTKKPTTGEIPVTDAK